jgi:amino-acid N-acetyltransferase
MGLIKPLIAGDQLLKRNRATIEKHISDYFVFEIDNNIVGAVALHPYLPEKKIELASLAVSPAHEHRGIGTKLAMRAEAIARDTGAESLFCLSTQAFTFFQHKLGYIEGSVSDLPASRRDKYEQSGRNSKILLKSLTTAVPATPPVTA